MSKIQTVIRTGSGPVPRRSGPRSGDGSLDFGRLKMEKGDLALFDPDCRPGFSIMLFDTSENLSISDFGCWDLAPDDGLSMWSAPRLVSLACLRSGRVALYFGMASTWLSSIECCSLLAFFLKRPRFSCTTARNVRKKIPCSFQKTSY